MGRRPTFSFSFGSRHDKRSGGGLRASIKCRILSSKDSVHFNHSSVTSINELNRFNVIEKMETIVDPSQAIQKRSGDNGGDLDIEPKKVKSSID